MVWNVIDDKSAISLTVSLLKSLISLDNSIETYPDKSVILDSNDVSTEIARAFSLLTLAEISTMLLIIVAKLKDGSFGSPNTSAISFNVSNVSGAPANMFEMSTRILVNTASERSAMSLTVSLLKSLISRCSSLDV